MTASRNPEQSARMKFLQAAEVAEEHIQAIEAERDRYRAALEEIAALSRVHASEYTTKVARKALNDREL